MWPYYPQLLASPVPRYTSYPTAAEFGPLKSSAYCQALEEAQGAVSLYVHIPFCEKICFYCGCHTAAVGKQQRLQSYLFALQNEIRLVASRLPARAKIHRIAFGGGSPNALSPADFLSLAETIAIAFQPEDPVWSIELDPRSLAPEWSEVIANIGITRASLGVQTFDPQCQRRIGRVQDEDMIVRSVDLLREAGITSLNFDLMYGLPGQGEKELINTLHSTRVLGADRVALFGYAHVPHLVPRQKLIAADSLPDQGQRFAMAAMGYSYFIAHGYTPVGFDHFARPGGDPLAQAAMNGTLRRNFQGFTDDTAPVLVGLGCSAISSFPDLLAQNEKNPGRYGMMASQGKLTTSRGIARSHEDRRRGAVIESLLCSGQTRAGKDLLKEAHYLLDPFVHRGLALVDSEWISITSDGLPYARTIAAQFDPYRRQRERRFSSAI